MAVLTMSLLLLFPLFLLLSLSVLYGNEEVVVNGEWIKD